MVNEINYNTMYKFLTNQQQKSSDLLKRRKKGRQDFVVEFKSIIMMNMIMIITWEYSYRIRLQK